MPSPLDWLDVSPQPQTSLFAPAVSPYRNYGLSAADAVRQGRQALPNLQAATTYADLMRQQSLAPMQQQVEQMRLQTQLEVQPQIDQGRDPLIQRLSALDPASDDYLTQRRDAVMQNPYGLADPIVQQVLQNNDRAYDDYISTKRLSMYNTPRTLTPGQQATIQHQVTRTTEALTKAQAMGDATMVARLTEELGALGALLSGSGTGVQGAETAPTTTAPAAPSTAVQMASLSAPEERWTAAKDAMISALQQEASDQKLGLRDLAGVISRDPELADDIFTRRLGAKFKDKAFDDSKTRSFWSGGTGVSWKDVYDTLGLNEDPDLLRNRGTNANEISGQPLRTFEDARPESIGSPKAGTWKIQQTK